MGWIILVHFPISSIKEDDSIKGHNSVPEKIVELRLVNSDVTSSHFCFIIGFQMHYQVVAKLNCIKGDKVDRICTMAC